MHAQLNAGASPNQQPENDHQRQVESAEGRGIQRRKCEVQSAAGSQQPDLIAVPHRPNASQHDLPFPLAAGQKWMQHADTQVEPVEHDINYKHCGHDPEPDEPHRHDTPRTTAGAVDGPWLIMR